MGQQLLKQKNQEIIQNFYVNILKLPINIKKKKNYDEIKVKEVKKINCLNYNIPSDISSSAFFIVLTALIEKFKILIKNVNINPSRIGIIKY